MVEKNNVNVIKRKKPLLEKLGFIEKIQVDKASSDNINSNLENKTVTRSDNTKMNSSRRDKTQDMENINDNKNIDLTGKLTIEEIFNYYGLSTNVPDNIYVIENYLKALPISLPNDIKKNTILNMIKATNLDISMLKADGAKKVSTLNEYIQSFSKKTDEMLNDDENKINEMLNQIKDLKQSISERKQIHEEQNSAINFEIEKIKSLLEFVNN